MSNTGPRQKISTGELKAKAETGDVEAQTALGLLYELGLDVPKADPVEAAKWWGKAAKSGSSLAQFSLAEIISNEFDDTDENRAMAQALYAKAESGGHTRTDKVLRHLDRDQGVGAKVLVVDGMTETRKWVCDLIESEGCVVISARDGSEALAKLRKNPDVVMVFSDINLEVLDGLGLVQAIRASDNLKSIPVVIMTAESSADMVLKAKKLGILGWMVKPAKAQTLRRYLSKIPRQTPARIKRTG